MDHNEIELWKMCDLNLRSLLTSIGVYSYLGKVEEVKLLYDKLMKRYEDIDIAKLDERFPIDVIFKTYKKLYSLGESIGNHERLNHLIQEISTLTLDFNTKRYEAYRNIVGEKNRTGRI